MLRRTAITAPAAMPAGERGARSVRGVSERGCRLRASGASANRAVARVIRWRAEARGPARKWITLAIINLSQPPSPPQRPFGRQQGDDEDEGPRPLPEVALLVLGVLRHDRLQPLGNARGIGRADVSSARRPREAPQQAFVEARIGEFAIAATHINPPVCMPDLGRAPPPLRAHSIRAGMVRAHRSDKSTARSRLVT